MYVDDVNVYVKGGINEVEEKVKPIRAKLTNDVGLLQVEMSGTEKGEEGNTNMLIPNMFLVCRLQIVGAKKRELELRSIAAHRGADFEARGTCHKWEWCS